MSALTTTLFVQEGHRWAFQALTIRSEVVSVMEEMLGTIEHWKLVNDIELYRFKLEQEHEEISRIKAANTELLESHKTQEKASEAMKVIAKDVRDKLVEDLIVMSMDLQAREAKDKKVHDLQKAADRVPKLEKELKEIQKALKETQKKLSQYKAYGSSSSAGGGVVMLSVTGRVPSHGSIDGLIMTGPSTTTSSSPIPPPDFLAAGGVSSSPTIGIANPVIHVALEQEHGLFATFMTLEEVLLLRVFSFLNAQDVLATAEVCKSFYDRVGAIFGKPSIGGGTSSTSPVGGGSAEQPWGPGGGGGGIEGGSGPTTIPPSKASAAAKSVLDDMPITDKLATSIASKLSGAELKGIIGMTEKLKKLEAVLMQMQTENEDIRARWQGTESVKDFLIAKLKNTEMALKKTMDGVNGAARQRSSDQEVISFLDGRVQELESALQSTADRFSELQEQHGKDKLMSQEQIRVLKDMLNFEKQKADDTEAQFRHQKKILAKEIKCLRGEVLAKQSERDSYRDELQILRRSLSSSYSNRR